MTANIGKYLTTSDMKNIKIHSASIFKHSGQIHLLPNPKIIYEPLNGLHLLTFEISFITWTSFVTFQLNSPDLIPSDMKTRIPDYG